jgi:hypothetical protein
MQTLHLTNPFMDGRNVRLLQSALVTAGLLSSRDVDGVYGPGTAAACEKAKWRLGYPTSQIHPGHEVAGDQLSAFLNGSRKPPLAYRLRASRRRSKTTVAKHPPPVAAPTKRELDELDRRNTVARLARWAVAHEPMIHYMPKRPMRLPPVATLPWTCDCSEFVTTVYRWAGCPDPNGLGYSGAGYTGTLLQHLKPIPQHLTRKGDLVVYGAAPGHHVCVIVDEGPDPLLVSHGQEAGPILIRHSEEARYQPRTVTWLQGVML